MTEGASSGSPSRWRRFRTSIRGRIQEADLDTLKRAAEVKILEEAEGRSTRDYSEAVARLIEASRDVDDIILEIKAVVLAKWTDESGRSRIVAKVLSPTEMVRLAQSGGFIQRNAREVYGYLTQGELAPGDSNSGELSPSD